MMTQKGRLFFIWVTANGAHEDHAVTDEENAARLQVGRAAYVGLCGDEFLGADMREPPGVKCARCSVIVDQWDERSYLIGMVLDRLREAPEYGLGQHASRSMSRQ